MLKLKNQSKSHKPTATCATSEQKWGGGGGYFGCKSKTTSAIFESPVELNSNQLLQDFHILANRREIKCNSREIKMMDEKIPTS
jgi:hypothetical protein